MNPPILTIDREFDLMVKYQLAIETTSVIIKNAPSDAYTYSLIRIEEPFPSYIDYLNGNDFNELDVITASDSMDYLLSLQDSKRLKVA